MTLKNDRYHEVVQKALEFMRSRVEAQISVTDVATHVSYSPDHLARIFHAVTGKGILQNLHDIRVETAKNLLRQTKLNIGEVAYAVGCENHSSFTRLFCRATGMSPALFRKTSQTAADTPPGQTAATTAKGARIVVRDDLASGILASWWDAFEGNWEQMQGYVEGSGMSGIELGLTAPLPENFRLQFEVRSESPSSPSFHVILRSTERLATPYCCVNFSNGTFRIGTRNVLSTPEAIFQPQRWCLIRLELNDNRITVSIDGKCVFSYRDLFPPPYLTRSRLVFSGPGGTPVRLRRLRVIDLGYLPMVPAVRQGDAFFNSGLFRQAEDFYKLRLRPELPADEAVELRYKIGLCLLSRGETAQCRNWIQSSTGLTEDPFWRRELDILLLRLEAISGDISNFERHVRRSARDPLTRDGIRTIVGKFRNDALLTGFYETVLRLTELQIELCNGHAYLIATHHERVSHVLKNLNRTAEARRILLPISRNTPDIQLKADALLSLADICLLKRDLPGARKFIEKARATLSGRPAEILCDLHEGYCCRAERRFTDAIALWSSFRSRRPCDPNWRRTGDLLAAVQLCAGGDTAKAARLIARLKKEKPDHPFYNDDIFRGYINVAHLTAGRYAGLAEILLPDSRKEDLHLLRHGQEAVTAGILFELAGDPDRAVKTWSEAARRFPPNRCAFWGSFAQTLAEGKPEQLEQMELFFQVRSELFYFLGLLHGHRGNTVRAQQLFTMSVQEDPLLNWPAQLSGAKLAESSVKVKPREARRT